MPDRLPQSPSLSAETPLSLGAPAPLPTHEPGPSRVLSNGPQIDGYDILGQIGQGGMGIVYRARQKGLGRDVAIKLLAGGRLGDETALARFQAEARLAAGLHHPNIVQIFEFGQCAAGPFIVMELINGTTLSARTRNEPQTPRWSAELIATLSEAVGFAHGRGVVHRDLKPANVLIAAEGGVKLADFGLAKELHSTDGPTRSGEILGTPSYMAPEQASGAISLIGPRTDIYSLGAMLYELLTGSPPFRGTDPVAVVLAVLSDDPVRPQSLISGIPRDLQTICLKCLQKSPRSRYESAQALADDLRRFLAGEPILASPPSMLARTKRWIRRRPAAAAMIASAVIGAGTFQAYSTHKNSQLTAALSDTQRVLERSEKNVRAAIEAADRRVELTGQPAATQYAQELEFFNRIRQQPGDDAGARYERALAARSAGDVLKRMSRSDDSLAAYQEARTALESLTAESPARADYRRDLAAVLNQTAVAHEARSEFEQSANTFQAAMELLESLLASTPNEPDLKRQLASVWNNRGRLQSRQRDFAAAESSYREAVRLRSELVKANPQSAFVRELMENLNNLAVIQGRLEKHQAAVDILNEAISTFRLLPESEQHEARPRASLATAQLNLAANLGPLGDLDRAVEFNRDGISTLQSLVRDFPEDARYHELCADAEINLAKTLLSQEKLADALAQFESAERRYRRLSESHPEHPSARASADRLTPGIQELREAVAAMAKTSM